MRRLLSQHRRSVFGMDSGADMLPYLTHRHTNDINFQFQNKQLRIESIENIRNRLPCNCLIKMQRVSNECLILLHIANWGVQTISQKNPFSNDFFTGFHEFIRTDPN